LGSPEPPPPPERRHDTVSRDRISELEQHYQEFQERVRASMIRKWIAIAGLWVAVFVAGAIIIDDQRDQKTQTEAIQKSRFEATRNLCERTNAQNRSIRFVLGFSRANVDDRVDSGELTPQRAEVAREQLDAAVARFPLEEDCIAYARLRVEADARNTS
jgi:hypothetical protein